MENRFAISLTVTDRCTGKTWIRAVDDDEFPVFSERFVEDLRAPADLAAFKPDWHTTVKALKQKSFRRDLLEAAARKLAARLADHMEDAEGWHGEERREAIKRSPA